MSRFILAVLLSFLVGCSSPPPFFSYTSTIVERRQDAIWVSTRAGGQSLFAKPGIDIVVVRIHSLPDQQFLAETQIQTIDDGIIPETEVYQIPQGEDVAYRVYIIAEGQSGGPSFDIPKFAGESI